MVPTRQTPSSILSSLPPTPHYLIFFSSPEERGRPWCRDCQAAEAPIASSIGEAESTIVWVGDRETWNDPASPWKHPPWNVERIPTILKLPVVGEGVAVEDRVASAPRIVEAEILEGSKLRAFVKA